jgi:hypothetical protein
MIETTTESLAVLLLLGAVHGLNPGMGWLFAVALGLQERSGRAVWRALGPLALGHGLAVAAAIALAVAAGLVLAAGVLRWVVAGALFGMGLFHLRRHRHPRWGGMRVGPRDLAIWSFLMATVHGAGLMALPFLPAEPGAISTAAASTVGHEHGAGMVEGDGLPAAAPAEAADPRGAGSAADGHAAHAVVLAGGGRWFGVLAALMHTAGYLAVTGGIATVVYHRLGLRLLGRVWINLDVIWGGALVLTALLVALL